MPIIMYYQSCFLTTKSRIGLEYLLINKLNINTFYTLHYGQIGRDRQKFYFWVLLKNHFWNTVDYQPESDYMGCGLTGTVKFSVLLAIFMTVENSKMDISKKHHD